MGRLDVQLKAWGELFLGFGKVKLCFVKGKALWKQAKRQVISQSKEGFYLNQRDRGIGRPFSQPEAEWAGLKASKATLADTNKLIYLRFHRAPVRPLLDSSHPSIANSFLPFHSWEMTRKALSRIPFP